jgi:hypothetical protein
MNEQQLRREAAALARDCRKINKSGSWTIREWNESLRKTYRTFMTNMRIFHRIHGTWET